MKGHGRSMVQLEYQEVTRCCPPSDRCSGLSQLPVQGLSSRLLLGGRLFAFGSELRRGNGDDEEPHCCCFLSHYAWQLNIHKTLKVGFQSYEYNAAKPFLCYSVET